MFSYRKVGGLHFIKIWRLSLSFCLTSGNKPEPKPARKRTVKLPRANWKPLYAPIPYEAMDSKFAAIETAINEAESILANYRMSEYA